MATLKKKVHDPKTKGGYKVVDVEPQYATLPLRDGPTRDSICTQVTSKRCAPPPWSVVKGQSCKIFLAFWWRFTSYFL